MSNPRNWQLCRDEGAYLGVVLGSLIIVDLSVLSVSVLTLQSFSSHRSRRLSISGSLEGSDSR